MMTSSGATTAGHNNLNMKLFQSVTSPDALTYPGMLECFPRLKVVPIDTDHCCNLVSCFNQTFSERRLRHPPQSSDPS
jgi:hypothetical protein